MFCPKCGTKLPDDSKFCDACGEKLFDVTSDNPNTNITPQSNNTPQNHFNTQANNLNLKKKFDIKKAIGISIAAVVVIVAIAGFKALLFNSGNGNAYAYLSDGTYELITNLNKDQIIEISSSKSENKTSNLLTFSPDGKYIYYYTKYDPYSETGSLCRAEYGKLKKDSAKNDKYIEIIAANIKLGFRFIDDESVVYKSGENTLYYFDGKKESQIDKDVKEYYIDEAMQKIVYSAGNDIDGYSLYGTTFKNTDNKIKLASDMDYIRNAYDFDNILYVKNEDDGKQSLYVTGFEKQPEKLASNVNFITQLDDKTYFTAENGKTLSLYDFVEDTYAEADAGITQPEYDDFTVPYYSYEMIRGSDLSENDFDELYTSCSKDLYWYGESIWDLYSMEEALNIGWDDDTEEIHAATQKFIDKFGDTADENGYILVTDEVKAALKEINKYREDVDEEWQWLWLCYNKKQYGTTVDYEAYDNAYNKWNEVKNRVYMRESLKNIENDFKLKTLYRVDDGKLTAVSENVLDAKTFTGAVMYNTTDLVTEKIDIENIYSVYEVNEFLSVNYDKENHVILSDGSSCRMPLSVAQSVAEANESDYAQLYFTTDKVYMNQGSGAMYEALIENNTVKDFSLVTDDAEIVSAYGSTVYYTSNSYERNGVSFCDLYSYIDGNSDCLAKDIIYDNIKLYSDGVMLAYTDYMSFDGYELTMFNEKGETTLISDSVSQYIRVDESTLLFISDGDLYAYDGKEKKMIRSDVDYIWSKNHMPLEQIFAWSDDEIQY